MREWHLLLRISVTGWGKPLSCGVPAVPAVTECHGHSLITVLGGFAVVLFGGEAGTSPGWHLEEA